MKNWSLQKKSLDNKNLLIQESLFALGNGYLGVRGNFEEGYPENMNSIKGTYINGYYDVVDISYAENAYGFPQKKDMLPNVIDSQSMSIFLDGELVSLFTGHHHSYMREIFFDKGMLERKFTYKTACGKEAEIIFQRLVSNVYKELFLNHLIVKYDGEIEVKSCLNGNVKNYSKKNDPRVSQENEELLTIKEIHIDDLLMSVKTATKNTNVEMACSTSHEIIGGICESTIHESFGKGIALIKGNKHLEVTKYSVYTDALRHVKPLEDGRNLLEKVMAKNFKEHLQMQVDYLDRFWKCSDIIINGSDKHQLALRFSLYQLMQSTGRDQLSNISAKGLSGEGYEGHYFWDTEIYVIPLLLINQVESAKKLLLNRYNMLDAAREEAYMLGHKKGVKFPWRTISGRECSGYFPAGTAQYHINGDIAYSFIQYFFMTDDEEFVFDYGMEVLLETARLWAEIGHYDNGVFKIDDVTGPDEYSAIVNNNYYTNAIAKYNLTWAVKIYEMMKEKVPEKLDRLEEKIKFNEIEIEEMKIISKNIYLPYDAELGIDLQDDSFLNKKKWDFKNTREDQYPLLLNFHPLTIYRHQVLKQADTVLAHFLLEDYTDSKTMLKSYEYYEPLTTHDSSLSHCVYGIMASKVGKFDRAYEFFDESSGLDLDNTHENTEDGLHMANLAGTAVSIIYGFAGLRIKEDAIHIEPWLPKEWKDYSFHLKYRGRNIHVGISDKIKVVLISGEPVDIVINKSIYNLENTVEIENERRKYERD